MRQENFLFQIRKPKLIYKEVISLVLVAEYLGIDSEYELFHKLPKTLNENIPANNYTFVNHATVYLNEARNPDFGKTTEKYRAGQAGSFGRHVLNAVQKESSYGTNHMNMINDYNSTNTGSVTITPYSGGNNLPTGTTITVSVGNSTYPSNPYEDIKHPQD